MAPSDRDRSYELVEEEELAAGLTRIAAGRAERALERLREADAGGTDAADAIHGARKDLKKLRTVGRLLRDELGGKVYRRENGRFRDAARSLSQSRDAAAKVETLEALAKHEEVPAAAVKSWRKILDRDREAAANLAGGGPAIGEAVALIEAGLDGIEGWNLEGDSWAAVDAAVVRTYRRGRRAMEAAMKGNAEAGFHEWRKRAKDLWYELRLFGNAWPGPLEATAEEAHRLTDVLGDHHDLAVLREDLRERNLGEEETVELEAAISHRQAELAVKASTLGHRLYAERPRDFSHRLRRYWEAWRCH